MSVPGLGAFIFGVTEGLLVRNSALQPTQLVFECSFHKDSGLATHTRPFGVYSTMGVGAPLILHTGVQDPAYTDHVIEVPGGTS